MSLEDGEETKRQLKFSFSFEKKNQTQTTKQKNSTPNKTQGDPPLFKEGTYPLNVAVLLFASYFFFSSPLLHPPP